MRHQLLKGLAALTLLGTLASAPANAALVTLQVEGSVDFVTDSPPPTGIGVGDAIGGSVTYDDADLQLPPSYYGVTSLTLNLPDSVTVTEADATAPPLVDRSTDPISLEGEFSIGDAYGFTGTILLSFSSLSLPDSPGTFEIRDENFVTVASGTLFLTAVPLPAALPLLASGLMGLGFMARRRSC